MRNLVLIAAALVAGCSAPEAAEQSGQAQTVEAPYAATSILNAGVAARLGEAKFLFDPLYDNHFGSLAELEQPLIDAIVNGDAPYHNVDAVFVSHAHGDHFSAMHLNRLLAAQPQIRVVAPGQAIAAMREHALWQDAFEERVTAIELRNGEAAKSFEIGGAKIEAIRTPHGGWPDRHADVHNITFRVSATSGSGRPVRVMHLGDADSSAQHFALNRNFYCCARTNLAIVPYWFFLEDDPDTLIDRMLNAEEAVGMHVPTSVPDSLESSGRRYFTGAGEEIPISHIGS